jgi:hypothetical protein
VSRTSSINWIETTRCSRSSAELQRLLGEARSELFHYEVRSTYDTPEIAEHRRLVDDALNNSFTLEDPEDEEPWRRPRPSGLKRFYLVLAAVAVLGSVRCCDVPEKPVSIPVTQPSR